MRFLASPSTKVPEIAFLSQELNRAGRLGSSYAILFISLNRVELLNKEG